MTPKEVEALVGYPASLLVAKGQSRMPGTTPFVRSVAAWSMAFEDTKRIAEMLPQLLESVGGTEHLLEVKHKVIPEFIELDLTFWILDSEEQEGGYFDAPTLKEVARLGATLSLGFYRRGP